MTGTSMDGIDLSLIAVEGVRVHRLDFAQADFPAPLRTLCAALHDPALPDALRRSAEAGIALAEAISALVRSRETVWKAFGAVEAIGVHGQTVLHRPAEGITLQINAPAWISELTGLTVVSDFRTADLAAGGQGAPLVPLFHEVMTRGLSAEQIALVNLGGIANVTRIRRKAPTGNTPETADAVLPEVVGFDTGPANMLLDLWAQRVLGTTFDVDGRLASQAAPVDDLVALMRADPYFAQRGPKSTGRDQFNGQWLDTMLSRYAAEVAPMQGGGAGPLSDAQVQASLVALTALTVAAEIPANASALYLCGGGAKNPVLREALQAACRAAGCTADLQTTEALGWPEQEVEAAAFAWLAYCCLSGQAGNLPQVTGARGPRVLGSVTRSMVARAV
ncbi:MAG: hypothetical protein RL258_428 [Pseudomonadota bacterium]